MAISTSQRGCLVNAPAGSSYSGRPRPTPGDHRIELKVRFNLSSNTVETILSAVQAGVGIGMFYRASLAGEFRNADVVTVLDEYISETRDVSLIWPNRKFISARVRQVTEFFALALAERI